MRTQRLGFGFPAGIIALCAMIGATPVQAVPQLLGHLTCTVIGKPDTETAGPAQGREVLCQFRPGASGPEELYVGTLQGAGQTKALFGKGTVVLAVKSSGSTDVTPGMLEQSYAPEASATTGGAAPLIGDKNKSIQLQAMFEKEGGASAGKSEIPEAVIVLVELKLKASPA
jgi:hypothetical protein